MKQLSHIISLLALPPMLLACQGKTQTELLQEEAEKEGAVLLALARQDLAERQFDKARQNIMNLRKTYPLALDARRRAILLLDSIEYQAAVDSVRFAKNEEWQRLTMKVQFYERKLQEDRKGYGDTPSVE